VTVPTEGATRVGVVDLGTNSTRLLVADVAGGAVRELRHETVITRFGQGVDATGELAPEAIDRVVVALEQFQQILDDLSPATTVALATSAMRDARNGRDFQRLVRERFGLEARTIPGDEEARLSFLGATSTRPPGGPPTLVLDIGGGSTEFVVGAPGEAPDFFVSIQAGGVRQTERHLHDDPPPQEQVADAALEVQLIIEQAVPGKLRASTDYGIAVAGTATSLAAIDQELDPYDRERVQGYKLGLGECERMLAMLAGMPLERRRRVPGLHPDRAPTIVAGTVIMLEAMRAFGLDFMETSEADILHGAALTAVRDAAT
jgi:exopolyphosphatase/guanosine-5'-triphosphate,3'-diphosphate pyrophosphatase